MTEDRLTGIRLGGYLLIRRLGRGGMATVYLARDEKLQREVAVKVLHGIDAADETFQARFQQEALATARLEHPNIVTIYDYGREGDYTYMVMEYCPNGSLHEVLLKASQQGRMLEQEYIVSVVSQVAQALDFAHRHGIIHRDVKPSNILFARDGRPVLADLGVAKAFSGPKLTRTLAAIGTPEYMSPEQGRGEEIDHRSDLYSLGVVLYELLSGHPPFTATTPWGIIKQHISEELPPIRQRNPAVPPGLAAVVAKAMAKAPSDRYQSGQELANALRAQVAPAIPPAPPPPYTPSPAPRRRSSGLMVVIIALALALAGVLAVAAMMLVPGLQFGPFVSKQQGIVVTVVAAATPAPLATATPAPPTATAMAPATVEVVAALNDTATATLPAITATAPLATATEVATATQTTTPVPTATPQPAAKPLLTDTPKPKPTLKPQTQPVATQPGTVVDFENFGDWRRGNEPYGTLTQTSERVSAGNFAGKLAYDIPAVDNNYVVFRRVPAATIPGQPGSLTMQVYGDGSGHYLKAWIQDSAGEVRQFTFGRVVHAGQWQPMTLALDATADWPQGHISGPDNGKLDYPIKLYGLVLDAIADKPVSGVLYLDALETGGEGVSTATAGGESARATPTPAAGAQQPPPAAALHGHIVYVAGSDANARVVAVDAATGSAADVANNAAQPDVRSDGRVVYNGVGGGREDLFTVNLDGSQGRMISMHSEDSYPYWSPSGASVVFHSSLQGDGTDRIYIQWDANTAQEASILQITGQDILGQYPTWLPNWRIAYSGCDYWDGGGSRCGIWTMESNGSGNPIQLTQRKDDRTGDAYGNTLLYSSQASGNWDIYGIPASGGEARNLTNSPSQDVNPTFSPDGNSIAFLSDREGRWSIWVMGADGSNPRRLIDVPASSWDRERLAWGP